MLRHQNQSFISRQARALSFFLFSFVSFLSLFALFSFLSARCSVLFAFLLFSFLFFVPMLARVLLSGFVLGLSVCAFFARGSSEAVEDCSRRTLLSEEARGCCGRGARFFFLFAVETYGRQSVCETCQRRGPA